MTRVNVSTLRAGLSRYLRIAQRGENVLVCERRVPIAKLVHVSAADAKSPDAERVDYLVEQGAMTAPRGRLPADFFDHMPKAKRSVVEALLDERRQGR